MKADIINAYTTATDNFITILSGFNQQQLNTIPFDNSWTPAQVADHIYKSIVNLPQLLTGSTKPAERQPDANNVTIGNIFLDFSTKLKSPDFILPTGEVQDRDALLQKMSDKRIEIQQTAVPLDETELVMDFTFPTLGNLTRWEWLHFVTCHTIRHTHQLENIHQQLQY